MFNYFISHPKAGRTWVRTMLIRYGQLTGQDNHIIFTHNGSDYRSNETPDEFLKKSRVILMVRDPRDIVVSYYFHLTQREQTYRIKANLKDFIRHRQFGIESIIGFYNGWEELKSKSKEFSIVRYEDLHKDCLKTLEDIRIFLNLNENRKALEDAVSFGSFENMQRLEKQGNNLYKQEELSYMGVPKVRRGVVGGYKDYLDSGDINYLNGCMKSFNRQFYGYSWEWIKE